MSRSIFLTFLLATTTSWLFSGCSQDLAAPGSRFLVSAASAQFYKYGPAQSFGADFVLPRNQRVIMLQRSFGFSKVMTDDGTTGWIASEELAPAPPEPRRMLTKAGRKGAPADRMFAGPRKNSKVDPVPGDPLFDMSDLPPPMPEDAALPKPNFRVNAAKPR